MVVKRVDVIIILQMTQKSEELKFHSLFFNDMTFNSYGEVLLNGLLSFFENEMAPILYRHAKSWGLSISPELKQIKGTTVNFSGAEN